MSIMKADCVHVHNFFTVSFGSRKTRLENVWFAISKHAWGYCKHNISKKYNSVREYSSISQHFAIFPILESLQFLKLKHTIASNPCDKTCDHSIMHAEYTPIAILVPQVFARRRFVVIRMILEVIVDESVRDVK